MLLSIKCASTDQYANITRNTFTGGSAGEIGSGEKIDQWKTFEIFFLFKNNEDCIKINITSEMFEEIENKKKLIKTYFIIEKAIDVSKFNSDSNILYSEISRNYDSNWTAKQEIEICSSDSDPIKRLNKGDLFRIRFTTFRDDNYKYIINIYSKNPVNISEKIPQ